MNTFLITGVILVVISHALLAFWMMFKAKGKAMDTATGWAVTGFLFGIFGMIIFYLVNWKGQESNPELRKYNNLCRIFLMAYIVCVIAGAFLCGMGCAGGSPV